MKIYNGDGQEDILVGWEKTSLGLKGAEKGEKAKTL